MIVHGATNDFKNIFVNADGKYSTIIMITIITYFA